MTVEKQHRRTASLRDRRANLPGMMPRRRLDPAARDPWREDSPGLLGMGQRADWLGGELDITSTPRSGALVRAAPRVAEAAP